MSSLVIAQIIFLTYDNAHLVNIEPQGITADVLVLCLRL